MTKKFFIGKEKQREINEIVGWKSPVFHQAKECYVSVSAFDPSRGEFRIKKFMLGHVKGKRAQRLYGEALVKRLTEKLMQGWNPWVELVQPLEYSLFDQVCDKYEEYLIKLVKEGNMREETLVSYASRLRILRNWNDAEKQGSRVFYTYQFDRHVIGRFLDYIFIDRNNSLQTRNNYLLWVKVFCKYLVERGYVSSDPSVGFHAAKARSTKKNRDIIPDVVLKDLHDWLEEHNRHFLLACHILHYCLVRPREMSFLKVGDFSVSRQTLRLHGDNTKNHNDAVITVPQQVMKLMIELGVFDKPSHYYLFSSGFAPGEKRKSEKQFRDYWQRYIRKNLNMTDRYKFYSLKDTGITNMLRANTDILTVRDQARHSSILITDIYTPKDIKDANQLLLNYKGCL